jgi:cytochrome P450 family 710 subfamily A protein
MKEVLRYRPPATMVPHIAIEDWKIDDEEGGYTVKKGSVILPSIWYSILPFFLLLLSIFLF